MHLIKTSEKTALAVLVSLLLCYESRSEENSFTPEHFDYHSLPENGSMFDVYILKKSHKYEVNKSIILKSNYELPHNIVQILNESFGYWHSLLEDVKTTKKPLKFLITAEDKKDSNAKSVHIFADEGPYKGSNQALSALFTDYPQLADAHIIINSPSEGLKFSTKELTGLPELERGELSLQGTMVHEIGHSFGFAISTDGNETQYFSEDLSSFTKNLHDVFGKTPKPGMKIAQRGDIQKSEYDSYFVTDKISFTDKSGHKIYNENAGVYFMADNVRDVLEGAQLTAYNEEEGTYYRVLGIPINCYEADRESKKGFTFDGSHAELRNGLMSHQSYRNISIFMEAELAMFQDIGINLDRRKFYGYSVYRDGSKDSRISVLNTNPYFLRKNGAYVQGVPSETPYGTGLHLYGSYIDVVQKADIYTKGKHAIGIRSDGVSENITIPQGTSVKADGYRGKGVLISYGKDNNLNIAGHVSAAGEHGNAVEFNFGSNYLGPEDYRGSYISTFFSPKDEYSYYTRIKGSSYAYTDGFIDGPLVQSFNLSGSIEGGTNAVYIGRSALVKEINLMKGASVSGSIRSDYDIGLVYVGYVVYTGDMKSALPLADFTTALNFGKKEGGGEDSDFSMSYDGNITAPYSMKMNICAGTLNYSGKASVLDVTVQKGATLKGSGEYVLHTINTDFSKAQQGHLHPETVYEFIIRGDDGTGTLINHGTVSPGSSIGRMSIQGNYVQESTGVLYAEYDDSSKDELFVSGKATLSGTVYLAPKAKAYHANGIKNFSVADFVKAGSLGVSGRLNLKFEGTSICRNSPTLRVRVAYAGENSLQVHTTRDYAVFASDSNERALASSLQSASPLDSSMKQALAAIDFSEPDGSTVRNTLKALKPSVYADTLHSLIRSSQTLTSQKYASLNQALLSGQKGGYANASPYFTKAHTGPDSDSVRAVKSGFAAGYDVIEENIAYGIALNAEYMSVKNLSDDKGSARSVSLGLHALGRPFESSNFHLFGSMKVGTSFVKANHNASAGSIFRGSKNDYTILTSDVALGIGYDFKTAAAALTPYLMLDFSLARQPSVRENGSSGLEQNIGAKTVTALMSSAGIRLTGSTLKLGDELYFIPMADLSYSHRLKDNTGSVTASFAKAYDSSYSYETKALMKNSANIGAGISLRGSSVSFDGSAGYSLCTGGRGHEGYVKLSVAYLF